MAKLTITTPTYDRIKGWDLGNISFERRTIVGRAGLERAAAAEPTVVAPPDEQAKRSDEPAVVTAPAKPIVESGEQAERSDEPAEADRPAERPGID